MDFNIKKNKLMEIIFDKPLDDENEKLLVNRKIEFSKLQTIINYQFMGIYGIAGETGSGKTSILNLLNTNDAYKLFVTISEKDSKEMILMDLLFKIAKDLEKNKQLKTKARKIIDYVYNEISEGIDVKAGISMIASGEAAKTRSKTKRFNTYILKEYLQDILNDALKVFGRVILIIDEIDKEKKEDVMLILDSLKKEFNIKDLIVIITLPFVIYREYLIDRIHKSEFGNLENMLKDIIYINNLETTELKELLLKRLNGFEEFFEPEIISEIAEFSDGNPREALWILNKTFIDVFSHGKEKTEKKDIDKILSEVAQLYMNQFELTELQKEILKTIKNYNFTNRSEFAKILEENNFKRASAYKVFDKFIEENILIQDKNGRLKVTGKIIL